jgi:asparagine synthase (glutamine-hydrolysing)
MCGIAGFVGPGSERDLRAMSDALIHRGPDGSGECIDRANGVFLAHRRLAILDIGGGEQPMWNEDGQIGVVFNGEIYNHLDLRRELAARGHVFKSDHSDTEVLVHGYEEWGEDLPLRLNGMFAFAIYDRTARRLFLARDRFGKKPLYYTVASGFIAFASELTALLRHPRVARSLDEVSLRKYFAYGFIPAPNSLYRDVAKLPGGNRLSYDIASGAVRKSPYWQFRIEPADRIPPDPEQSWGEELRALLSQAVKRRLVSDVPLGIFLSGGIDSSAVLAFATKHVPPALIKSFSIGFHEQSFDESAYAQRVASLFGTDHSHGVLDLEQASELIPDLLSRLDEPMGDSSLLPTYLLCEFARKRVTVALGGDGGDELFAGYDPFKALRIAQMYRKVVPGWLHRGLRSLAELLPVSERNMGLDFKVKRGLRGVSYPESIWNPVWLGPLEPSELQDLFRKPVRFEEVYDDAIGVWAGSAAENLIDRTLEFYTRFYLQDDILTKVDRASMMVSLEVRAPFLDNDVVEFARRIPHQYKFRGGQTKYLLKRALQGVLPHDIIYRKKKGFGIPLARWLRNWKEPEVALRSPATDTAWVSRRWNDHRNGTTDDRLFLWCWTVLQYHLAGAAG